MGAEPMKCSKFPEREAAGICAYSGKPYCAEELVEVQGKMYAKDNLGFVMAEMKEKFSGSSGSTPMVFMNAGGGGAAAAAAASPASAPTAPAAPAAVKSRGVAIVLALFLGWIGVHKFYLGSYFWGFVYLLFCWTGIPMVIGWVEALNYLFMSDTTFYRRYG
jgi:TM2 domain-containing membrane protein YozV